MTTTTKPLQLKQNFIGNKYGLVVVGEYSWALNRERLMKEPKRDISNADAFKADHQGIRNRDDKTIELYVNGSLAGRSPLHEPLESWCYHQYGPLPKSELSLFRVGDEQERKVNTTWSAPETHQNIVGVPTIEYILDKTWFPELKSSKSSNYMRFTKLWEKGFFLGLEDTFALFYQGTLAGQSKSKNALLGAAKFLYAPEALDIAVSQNGSLYRIPALPKDVMKRTPDVTFD